MTASCLIATLLNGLPATTALPLPYTPRMDDVVTLVLLGCFFLTSYILSRSRKLLLLLVKDFLLHRERTSIFANSTAGDMRSLLLLVIQTGVLSGTLLFTYTVDANPAITSHIPPSILLAIYAGACLLYIFAKWLLYSLLGWIFFDESRTQLWIESYSTLLYYSGFALFPLVLLAVYFNLSLSANVIIGLFLVVFIKILMIYKWIKLFCPNLYGGLPLILYFCALEIMPYLVAYRGLIELNGFLILNY